MIEAFQFLLKTKILFGWDAVTEVGPELQDMSLQRPFVVTDQKVARSPHLRRLCDLIEQADSQVAGVFQDIPEESEMGAVEALREAVRGTRFDCFIALGGGSVIDTTKACSMLLKHGGSLIHDYRDGCLPSDPLTPLLAVPTTAGPGSEVSMTAMIKHAEGREKVTFMSPVLAPDVAILDPTLTLSMPPNLTAACGFDALTHCVESIHSTLNTPISDAMACYAIGTISSRLAHAVEDGHNRQARERLMLASTIAGMAFSNALVGCVHAMSHAIGGLKGVRHGLVNAILLPECMRFNLEDSKDRYELIARALGVGIQGAKNGEAARRAISEIERLRATIRLPTKLSDVGVSRDDFSAIAEAALADEAMATNPRELTHQDVIDVLRRCL